MEEERIILDLTGIGGLEIRFIFPAFMEKIWMHSGIWGVIISVPGNRKR